MNPSNPMPRRVGPYEILDVVAQGGMGIVYRAQDTKLHREVALKMMLGGAWSDEESQRRFVREAKLLAELRHPGIVPVHDMGVEDGNAYYTMDLVEGEPLDQFITRHKLPLAKSLKVFIQVCAAMHYAHGRGVVHRDLKPANVLVSKTGRPVILDFGIAHLSRSLVTVSLQTLQGTVMGTPAYMAPEQAQGKTREIDARTDVYALGVILYEIVTRKLPFAPTETFALLKAIVEEEPRRPTAWIGNLDSDLEAVILKGMAKEPARRYPSAHELGEDLKRYLAGRPVLAHPDSLGYRVGKWMRRHRELSASLAAALLALAALGGWSAYRLLQADRQMAQRAREFEQEQHDRAVKTQRMEEERIRKGQEEAAAREKLAREELERTKTDAEAALKKEREGAAERERLAREATERTKTEAEARFQAEREEAAAREKLAREEAERAKAEAEARLRDAPQPASPDRRAQAEALLQQALRMQRKGDADAAMNLLNQSVETDPDFAPAHHNRGLILQAQGKLDEALAAYDRTLQLDAKNAEAQVNQGIILQKQQKPEEALKAFDKALEIEPDDSQTHSNRGWALLSLGRLDEALASYDKALKLKPHDPEAGCNRGVVLQAQGKLEEALKAFDQALADDPKYPWAHLGRGMVLQGKGKLSEALKAFRQALTLDPALAEAHSRAGSVLLAQGNQEAALKSFDQALKLDGNIALAHHGRGVILLAGGNPAKALEAFDQALTLDANIPEAHYRRGTIYQKQRKIEEAVQDYEQALAGKLPAEFCKDCQKRLSVVRGQLPTDAEIPPPNPTPPAPTTSQPPAPPPDQKPVEPPPQPPPEAPPPDAPPG